MILLITAGALLIGGSFLWTNHIIEETRKAEELDKALSPKKRVVKTQTTTVVSQFEKIKTTISTLPQQLFGANGTALTDSKSNSENGISNLALNSQTGIAMPATTRDEAIAIAKNSVGKVDPLSPIIGFKKFPTSGERTESSALNAKSNKAKEDAHHSLIPPPPTGSIPPPPPPIPSGYTPEHGFLPITELPSPPEKPSIARYLKLVGIVGDKAFLSVVDPYIRRVNRLPKVLALSPGDKIEYLSVVSINDSSVTLEEDGHRTVKRLGAIR
ncbi:MAG: hypothetical protein IAF58_15950 [Leptolyngbya sp.]|nr:hypothetical protein [Candidatus Melainabacteria bacterium]